MFSIKKVALNTISPKERKQLKKIYKASFACTWNEGVPFLNDQVYIMSVVNTGQTEMPQNASKIAGFCMIHATSPASHIEKKTGWKLPYLYNFCITPGYRKKVAQKWVEQGLISNITSVELLNHIVADSEAGVTIDCEHSITHVMKFWTDNGFEALGECCANSPFTCMIKIPTS